MGTWGGDKWGENLNGLFKKKTKKNLVVLWESGGGFPMPSLLVCIRDKCVCVCVGAHMHARTICLGCAAYMQVSVCIWYPSSWKTWKLEKYPLLLCRIDDTHWKLDCSFLWRQVMWLREREKIRLIILSPRWDLIFSIDRQREFQLVKMWRRCQTLYCPMTLFHFSELEILLQ